jgi:hypothetical protein
MLEEVIHLCSQTTDAIRGFNEHRGVISQRIRTAQMSAEEEKKDQMHRRLAVDDEELKESEMAEPVPPNIP